MYELSAAGAPGLTWPHGCALPRAGLQSRALAAGPVAMEQLFWHAACVARKPAAGAQVVKYRARLHHKLGQAERAVALLEACLCQFPDAADLTHINMLAELYMEAGRCAPAPPT